MNKLIVHLTLQVKKKKKKRNEGDANIGPSGFKIQVFTLKGSVLGISELSVPDFNQFNETVVASEKNPAECSLRLTSLRGGSEGAGAPLLEITVDKYGCGLCSIWCRDLGC